MTRVVDIGRLNDFERIPFAVTPTPLEPMPRLGAELGIPNLWVKRDDLTGLAVGGNKARKLEYLMAEARAQGADHVVTIGGRQSNHCRMTAAAAARMGMGVTLVLGDPDPGDRPGNLLLDEVLGAELVFLGESNLDQMDAGMNREIDRLRREGKTPYAIPIGGSVPLGELGFVTAAREFADQCVAMRCDVDTVVMAVGSAGTAAGLALGLRLFSPRTRLVGVSVSRSVPRLKNLIAEMANEIAKLIEIDVRITPDDYDLTDAFIGPRYGVPSSEALSAIQRTARTEGILLDPVYTGKAMSGLIGLAREGRFSGADGVVFWHTGGLPALFAFEEDVISYTEGGWGSENAIV